MSLTRSMPSQRPILNATLQMRFTSLRTRNGPSRQSRRAWARNLALMLAVCNLLLLPLGTALGLYTLWVLLHEEVRTGFHA